MVDVLTYTIPTVIKSSVRYAPGSAFKWKMNAFQQRNTLSRYTYLLPEHLADSIAVCGHMLW